MQITKSKDNLIAQGFQASPSNQRPAPAPASHPVRSTPPLIPPTPSPTPSLTPPPIAPQALVFEDALELVVDLLGSLTATPEPLSLDGLVGKFSDAMLSNYMIMFFRLIASAEVRRRAEFFEPFILGARAPDVRWTCGGERPHGDK